MESSLKNYKSLTSLILAASLLFFPVETLAAPVLVANNLPQSAVVGDEFAVGYSIASDWLNTSVYIKALGGEDFYNVQTKNESNVSWLSWNAPWSDFQSFSTNNEGSASGQLKVKYKTGTPAGSQQFKLRARKTDSETNYDSQVYSVTVIEPTPTPTPNPTLTPTSAPSSTTQPTSTATPTKIPTPVPTKTPTIAPTKASTITPPLPALDDSGSISDSTSDNNQDSLVLGIQNALAEPPVASETAVGQKGKVSPAGIILIITGVLFLAGAGYAFWVNLRKNQPEDDSIK